MRPEHLFPAVMVALSIGAAVVYACGGRWPHAAYWMLAAAITSTVTFWMR